MKMVTIKHRLKKHTNEYKKAHDEMYQGRDDKFVSLMDIALLGMKKLRAEGKLEDMEVSDEINACSIVVPVEIDHGNGPETEEWLVFFKNETHNHPTEIEPSGGAATCLGGAIGDPLSGRGYVYQAMRVTGAADPTKSQKETMEGKLSQRKIVTGLPKVIVHMVIRLVWQPDLWMKYIIQIMLQNVWRLVPLWVLLQEKM